MAARLSARRPGDARVLVVEDDDDLRLAVTSTLDEAGYEVDAVADGVEATGRLLTGERPDLLVLDLKMPRKTGWELLRWLRDSPSFVGLPVIVFSANIDFPPGGAIAWLRKPVRDEVLLRTVREVLTSEAAGV
jgi:CheY-like chemotaxis protein